MFGPDIFMTEGSGFFRRGFKQRSCSAGRRYIAEYEGSRFLRDFPFQYMPKILQIYRQIFQGSACGTGAVLYNANQNMFREQLIAMKATCFILRDKRKNSLSPLGQTFKQPISHYLYGTA
jgi:hypothetical protein